MTVSVTDQALFFAGALVMGAAVGLLYDAFRILRVRVRLPLLGGVLDLLFWLVVTVALFVYTTTAPYVAAEKSIGFDGVIYFYANSNTRTIL